MTGWSRISHRLRRRRPPRPGTTPARARSDGADRKLWGRDRELTLFEEALRGLGADGGAPPGQRKLVFDVDGPPGFGKEWLLRGYQALAREAGAASALVVDVDNQIPLVLGHLAGELGEDGEELPSFGGPYEKYRRAMKKLEADPKAAQGLPALAELGVRMGVKAGRHLPLGTGLVFEVLNEDVAVEAARWAAERLGNNRDELELVTNPIPTLTRFFLEDLGTISATRPAVLLLDVDDSAHEVVGRWLLRVVAEHYGPLPERLLIAVAGVRSLPRNEWIDFEDRLQRLELGPLSEEDARGYLAEAGVTDPDVVEKILRQSGRVPLVLAMHAAGQPTDPAQIVDVTGAAVESFLASVSDPAHRRLAIDASAARLLDRDVLAALLEKGDVGDDFAWLAEQPFVDERQDGRVIKESVRAQLVQRSRRDAPQSWRSTHDRLATYYERLQGELELEPPDDWQDETWRRYEVEATFHRLCRAHRTELDNALQGFATAFGVGRSVARRMAEAIAQAGREADAREIGECGERLVAGLDALDREDWDAARPVFAELIESDALEPPQLARALDWRGYLALRAGRAEEALDDLGAAIAIEPESPEYRMDRATTLSSLGRYEEALEDYARAIEADPSSVHPLIGKSAAEHFLGRTDQALADIERAVEIAPDEATPWALRGELLQLVDRTDDAVASLDRAVELAPDDPSILAARARIRLELQDAVGAIEDLTTALAVSPDDVGLQWLRVLALAKTGDAAGATAGITDLAGSPEALLDILHTLAEMPPAVFERQAEMASKLTGIPLRQIVRDRQLAQLDRDVALRVLRVQSEVRERMARGDAEGALELYSEVIELVPTATWLLTQRAEISSRLGRFADTEADLDRALELAPDDADVRAVRARLRLQEGRPEEALAEIDRAVELDPDDLLLRSVRFMSLSAAGDLSGAADVAAFLADRAEDYVNQVRTRLATSLLAGEAAAVEDTPAAAVRRVFAEGELSAAVDLVHAAAAEARARLERAEGDLEGALAAWTESLAIAPDQPGALLEKGEIERLLGRQTEALADLDRAIELGADTAAVRGTRGQVLHAMDRIDEALADLDQALAEEPDLPWARMERAKVLVTKGRPQDAVADVDRVLKLQPENLIARSFRLSVVQGLGDPQEIADTYAVLADHAEEFVQQARASIPLSAAGARDSPDAVALRSILEGDEARAARVVRAEAAGARADLKRSQGDPEGAVACLNEALDLNPDFAAAYLGRAQLQHQLGRPAEALADLDRAIESGADDSTVRAARGEMLKALGRLDEALSAFEQALAADGSLTSARIERADIFLAQDQAEDALAEVDRAIELGDDTPVVRGTRGQALNALGRRDEALADLDRALAADPSLAWAHEERAEILLDERRYEEALAELHGLLERGLEAGALLWLRGRANAELNRHEAALADYERAAQLLPDAGGFPAERGELLLLLGRPRDALAITAEAVKDIGDGAETIWLRYMHALARRALDEQGADESLRRLVAEAESLAGPERDEAHLLQAAIFSLSAGDEEKAERLLAEAAESDDFGSRLAPDMAAFLENLAKILPGRAGVARRLAAGLASPA